MASSTLIGFRQREQWKERGKKKCGQSLWNIATELSQHKISDNLQKLRSSQKV